MRPNGIILCGGHSKRMGQNKALLKIGGISLIEHVINALLPIVGDIILSTNSNEFDFLPHAKIPDQITGIGPIAGFYSALIESDAPINIILSCDSPFITTKFLQYLLDNSNNSEIVLPIYNGKIQTVTGLFKKSIVQIIQAQIDKNNYVPVNIFEKCNTKFLSPKQVEFENLDSIFFNINNLDDYEKAIEIYNRNNCM